jgi:Tol biopolymer transport system component
MIGQTIGAYSVVALLGRGGMGEVYRARDTRLDRDVALKILPPDLATDADRLGRFQREARLLAALQHENIASIYGLEEVAGQPLLVMELAAGDDLSVRLGAGPLDVDEAERIARQLARGLEYAHERGIVHRDLKPANVKLGPDGKVKILDFGLARALGGSGDSASGAAAMSAVTQPPDLTRPGTVLGTAAYMSPEQARGYAVDRRTDIWAFGVILWEMLTGQQLFAGETASDTMAAILRQEPDPDQLPPDTPPVLVQLIQRCLQKDPQQRLRDIGEVRIALDGGSASFLTAAPAGPARGPAPAAADGDGAAPRRGAARWPWVLAATLAVMLGGVALLGFGGHLGPAPPPPPLVQAQVALPVGTSFYLNPANPGPPVVSPDGRHVAYAALDTTGQVLLFVRSLADATARPLGGTRGAAYPFWAPNSRELGFFRDGDLCRVDIAGGPVVTICPADNGKGGSWNQDDVILFAPTHVASIWSVPATGGQPSEITAVAADSLVRSHRFPCWLPDGRHFLYLAWYTGSGRGVGNETALRLASLDGATDRELMATQTNAAYVDGQILHVHDSNLMSRPFSAADLEFTGPPRPLLGEVLALQAAHAATFSASGAGVLAYVGGSGVFGRSRLSWHAPDGEPQSTMPHELLSPQGLDLAADGRRLAIAQADQRTGTYDIWVYEVGREVGARFTFHTESELSPVWSSDGRWITYASTSGGDDAIYRKLASGAGQPELLVEVDGSAVPAGWSHDDRKLAFQLIDDTGDADIWLHDLDHPDTLRPLRATPFNEGQARFSPDDRWLAYTSLESGSPEVYVERLEAGGGRYRISTDGGSLPIWAGDGTAVFFLDVTGRIQRTTLEMRGESLVIGETVVVTDGVEGGLIRTYDVDRTTGRLVAQRALADRVSDRLQLVTGWQNLLER